MEQNIDMSPYSFGTLWQEITQGVGYMSSAIMGGMADIFGTRAYYNAEQTRYEEQRKIANFSTLANSGKNGGVILAIGLLALIAIVAYIIYSKDKND